MCLFRKILYTLALLGYTDCIMDPEELRNRLRHAQKSHNFGFESRNEHQEEHKNQKTQHNNVHEHTERHKKTNPQVIFSWEAPMRAYKKRSAGVLRFYAAVAVLLSIIAIFFREYVLIIPIWSVLFLIYVLTITPPPSIRNVFSKFGIETAGALYKWENLAQFYFIKKFDYNILVITIDSEEAPPLYLVLPDGNTKRKVFEILTDKLLYVEHPDMTMTDKFATWLTTLMPEEENPAPSEAPEERSPSRQTYEPTV